MPPQGLRFADYRVAHVSGKERWIGVIRMETSVGPLKLLSCFIDVLPTAQKAAVEGCDLAGVRHRF